jgi:hypothetical protein
VDEREGLDFGDESRNERLTMMLAMLAMLAMLVDACRCLCGIEKR